MSIIESENLIRTHAKEGHKPTALKISCFWIGKLRPDFLKRSHLRPCNGLGATRCLENVGEVLDDHTCLWHQYAVRAENSTLAGKHIDEDVLSRKGSSKGSRGELFH